MSEQNKIITGSIFRDLVDIFDSDKTIDDIFGNIFDQDFQVKLSSDIKETPENIVISKELEIDYKKVIKELYFQNITICKKIKTLQKYHNISYKDMTFLEQRDFGWNFVTLLGGLPIKITMTFGENNVKVETRIDYKI